MGAWIETVILHRVTNVNASHPMWVRGLKLDAEIIPRLLGNVAPHVGAWIET